MALSIIGARLGFSSVSKVTVGFSSIVSAARDSTHAQDISWEGVLVGDLSLTGISGLDSGSEASETWYAVHIIAGGGNPVAVLFSTSSNSPILPGTYTVFRRIGWVRNDDGSNILRFTQIWGGANRKYWWDDVVNDHQVLSAGNATTFTIIECSTSIPPNVRDATLRMHLDPKNSNSEAAVRTPGFSAALENTGMDVVPGASRPTTSRVFVATNEDRQIEYRVSATQDSLNIEVVGFADELDVR